MYDTAHGLAIDTYCNQWRKRGEANPLPIPKSLRTFNPKVQTCFELDMQARAG